MTIFLFRIWVKAAVKDDELIKFVFIDDLKVISFMNCILEEKYICANNVFKK
jgi:hypothetical protein